MDATLTQLLAHIYELEQQMSLIGEFLLKNEKVLRDANAVVPGLDPQEPAEPPQS